MPYDPTLTCNQKKIVHQKHKSHFMSQQPLAQVLSGEKIKCDKIVGQVPVKILIITTDNNTVN